MIMITYAFSTKLTQLRISFWFRNSTAVIFSFSNDGIALLAHRERNSRNCPEIRTESRINLPIPIPRVHSNMRGDICQLAYNCRYNYRKLRRQQHTRLNKIQRAFVTQKVNRDKNRRDSSLQNGSARCSVREIIPRFEKIMEIDIRKINVMIRRSGIEVL